MFSNGMRKLLNYWNHHLFIPPNQSSTSCVKDHHLKYSGISCSKDHPSRHLRGGILQSLSASFKALIKVIYDLYIHQVVLNRGHGFSKRFIPAGGYTLPTRTNRLFMPPVVALFREVPAECELAETFTLSNPILESTQNRATPSTCSWPPPDGTCSCERVQIRVRPSLGPGHAPKLSKRVFDSHADGNPNYVTHG